MLPQDEGVGGGTYGPNGQVGPPSPSPYLEPPLTFPTPGTGAPTSPLGPTSHDQALALLADLQASLGLDIPALLSVISQPDGPTTTRDGVLAPGTGPDQGLDLTDEQRVDLERELCDLCDRAERATEPMVAEEQEIRDAYSQQRASTGGMAPGAGDSELVSEQVMVEVDQATARIVTNIMSVAPPIKVDPIPGKTYDAPDLAKLARSTEAFLNNYILHEMDYRHLLPVSTHRACKVGTAVKRIDWHEREEVTRFFTRDSKDPVERRTMRGDVQAKLIENRLMIVWPPTINNWQRDYEVVGHEAFLSRSAWHEISHSWDLPADVRAQIESLPGERDEKADADNARAGIDSQQMDGQKLVESHIKITELWCHLYLASHGRRVKFYCFIHRPTRRLLWIGYNPHFTQKHPYFPQRYKWSDFSAWGVGVGHEALNCWAYDTASWNLDLENLAAGAFWLIVRNAGAGHNTQRVPVRPGQEVWSDKPTEDFLPKKMGGEAAELTQSRQENERRLKSATGFPDVARGMGDETMKSGAGTGSTLALIEQAGVKIKLVDQCMREDLSDEFMWILELVAQYGSDGVFYNHVGADDATVLEQLKYFPPRNAEISSLFRIRAMAPNAATSNEARRNNALVIWGFAQEAVGVMNQFVTPLLQAEGKVNELARWQRAMASTLHEMMRRVVELHEMPGILGLMPEGLPESTPEDQVINQLSMERDQALMQLQQLQAQLQAIMETGDPNAQPAAPTDGGAGGAEMAPPPPSMSDMAPPVAA